METITDFFRHAGTRIKENLPGVIRNYPYSSIVLFAAGVFVDGMLRLIF